MGLHRGFRGNVIGITVELKSLAVTQVELSLLAASDMFAVARPWAGVRRTPDTQGSALRLGFCEQVGRFVAAVLSHFGQPRTNLLQTEVPAVFSDQLGDGCTVTVQAIHEHPDRTVDVLAKGVTRLDAPGGLKGRGGEAEEAYRAGIGVFRNQTRLPVTAVGYLAGVTEWCQQAEQQDDRFDVQDPTLFYV